MRRERRYGVRDGQLSPSETEVTASWSNRYPVGSADGHYRSDARGDEKKKNLL